MAKQNPLLTLKGMYGLLTIVKSPKYGDHIRAARGTYKKAKLNAACRKHGKELLRANGPAKVIKDALAPYRKDFYDGSMWSRLLSLIKKAQGENGSVDFGKLKGFEIHEKYPLRRFFNLTADTKVDEKKSTLEVRFTFDTHATFEKRIDVDAYRLRLIGIFPDMKKQTAAEASDSGLIKVGKGKPAPIGLEVPVQRWAKIFLICVCVQGYKKGKPVGTLGSQGMAIVKVGYV